MTATHRPIPDVARMIAILRDCPGSAADDVLREAAMTRPVSDLVQLAELLRAPAHSAQGKHPTAQPDPPHPR
ncbi:hypothetical protein OG948_40265 (plasmid) [Embleya sp. NBC_00888]|uniref:hypothetical protein n=1 Tax=Embleya sp. NBC_00888 TaxID=2975960 RepID=UPI002F9071C5|nr:hypothetical protein OG948_40265 [Embleya sp. NBC_00888]